MLYALNEPDQMVVPARAPAAKRRRGERLNKCFMVSGANWCSVMRDLGRWLVYVPNDEYFGVNLGCIFVIAATVAEREIRPWF